MERLESSIDKAQAVTLLPPRDKQLHVAVLFARVGPYHFARLKAAATRLKVTAVEFSDVDLTYAWDLVTGNDGFQRVTLFPGVSSACLSWWRSCRAVDKTLNGLRPTAVAIPGWSDGRSLAALKWCARNSVPAVMMSESNACDNKPRVWKEVIKSRLVRLCSAGLVGGKTHADYLAQLGMPKDRVFLGYDAIDNEYFAQKSNQARTSDFQPPAANPPLRNGLPKRYFLASARFVEKKNLPRLIQAYARYRTLASEAEGGKRRATVWDLVILGDGALRSELCRLSIDLHLQECVHVPGFKQYPDLPAYYGFAGAFIHASTTEQWGLVVNEAMASGLPVLVSNRCGCASDLVREGVNGFTFDPYNIEQLARLMLQLSDVEFQLSAFGEASRKIIATWGPERFASGLKAAVTKALEVGPIKASIVEQVILNALVAK